MRMILLFLGILKYCPGEVYNVFSLQHSLPGLYSEIVVVKAVFEDVHAKGDCAFDNRLEVGGYPINSRHSMLFSEETLTCNALRKNMANYAMCATRLSRSSPDDSSGASDW